MKIFFKTLISLVAIALAAIHIFIPSISIDLITLSLFALAILPWVFPFIKDFEIPGVVKISLPETKAATEKISKNRVITAETGRIKITTAKAKITRGEKQIDDYDSLRRLSETQPNLALVGFRIALEKRIVKLAESFNVPTEHRGLQRIVSELENKDVISKPSAAGLFELIALGNQAAHGAQVSREAADWVLDVGPSILLQLEDGEGLDDQGKSD